MRAVYERAVCAVLGSTCHDASEADPDGCEAVVAVSTQTSPEGPVSLEVDSHASTPVAARTAEDVSGEAKLAAILKPFGWTCTDEFWRRYYTDSWVFNLCNAVEALADEVARLQRQIDGSACEP